MKTVLLRGMKLWGLTFYCLFLETSIFCQNMSFGQKILEKFGYKEGDGLGKNGSGIKTAIKANFKVSTSSGVQQVL